MSSAGAEWVKAPTEIRSAPAAAYSATRVEGHPAGTSTGTRHDTSATAADFGRDHVVEQHQIGTCVERHRDLVEGVALDLARQGGPSPLGLGDGRLDGEAGQMVVLDEQPSESEPRWLTPPPARTAAFSRALKPGVVLRVSRNGCRARPRRRTTLSGSPPPRDDTTG